MDRTYIDNHHVVARYLADRLSEDERREFETHLPAHPEIVKELEVAARLKVGLRTLKQRGELDGLLKTTPWFRDTRKLAMAASVAVIAVGALIWIGRGVFAPTTLVASLNQLKDRGGHPLSIASTHAILRTRGPANDAEIELPDTPRAIELRVLPEIEAHPPRYRVALARIADDDSLTEAGSVANLTPAEDGFVTLYLDASQFTRGRYRLTIGGDRNTDAALSVSAFKIRLVTPRKQNP